MRNFTKPCFIASRFFSLCKYYTVLLLVFCLAAVSPAFSQSNGIYESYAIISINGGGNAYYDMAASTPNTDFQGANLGTYNYTQSLVVKGGQNKTFKCSGGDITNGAMNWRVWKTSAGASGGFSSISYGFVSNDAGGCGGNQTWEGTGGTTNVITGLAPGNYTLEVYSTAGGTPNNPAYSNNGGNNYRATFTVTSTTNPVIVNATTGTAWAEYATLGAAFTAINAGTHTGVITISIDGNTAETGSAALNASGSGSASYSSISIQPTNGAVRTISGNIAGPLVNFNGADNVTVDGLNTGGNGLVFVNSSAVATANTSTIQFILDATNNIIQNCTIRGSATGTAYGGTLTTANILFATGTSTGNDNNQLLNNVITANGTAYPTQLIASYGNSGATNDNITVTGNNLFDFFSTTGMAAINVGSNSSSWTISNNKIYQATDQTTLAAANFLKAIVINTSAGGGYTITGNTIGYKTAASTGMLTNSGGRFTGIELTAVAATPVSSIQGNTINGINWTTSSGATSLGASPFNGIYVGAGGVNIGTTAANIIGASSGVGSASNGLYFTSTTSGTGIYPIYITSSNNCTISNNTIGAIATGGAATIGYTFNGISLAGTGSHTLTNNTIGNSTANNIAIGTNSITTAATSFTGIYSTATGSSVKIGDVAGTGNIIQNSASFGSSTSSYTYAIYNIGAASNLSINYNTVSGNDLLGGGSSSTTLYNTLIYNGGSTTGVLNINNNILSGVLSRTSYAGAAAFIYNGSAGSSSTVNINSNSLNAFNFSGATGSTGTFYAIGQAATPLTENISNNNFNNLSIKSTGTIYLIFNSYSGPSNATKTVQNNTVTTAFTRNAGGSSSLYAYYDNGSSPSSVTHTINGNNFSNISNGTSTGTLYGINSTDYSGSNPILNVYNNLISGLTASSSVYAMNLTGFGGTSGVPNGVYGNTISNLSSGNTTYGINIGTQLLYVNVYSNTINSLSSTGGSVYPLYISGGSNQVNAYRNKIYGISSSNSAGQVYGIYVSAGTLNNIYNNIVGDLSSTAYTSASSPYMGIMGIYLGGGTTNNLYNNTVYIGNITSSGTNFSTSGIYASSSPTTVLLQNNLVVNLSTPKGSGRAIAFHRGTTTLTNYSNSSNYNSFYGTSGLFWDGTNNYTTLAAYKTAMATRDQNSFAENPTFASTTGSAANYLHINSGSVTPLESGGTTIALFNTDFDGDARPGPAGSVNGGASAYDIGADEFDGVPSVPTITFNSITPPGNQCANIARTITVSINPRGTLTAAPVLSYQVNGGAVNNVTMTGGSLSSTSTWTAVIPTVTPSSGTVTWSVAASNGITATYSGTSYADEPNTGMAATAVANPATICVGSPTSLSVTLTGSGTGVIGSGSTASSTAPTPFSGSYGGMKGQYIILASELTAAGYVAGNFTSIGINFQSAVTATYTDLTIQIGNTALNAFPSTLSLESAGLSTYYGPTSLVNPPAGVTTFVLATPFSWNGTSNIIISTNWSNNASTSTAASVLYTTTAFNSAQVHKRDSYTPAALLALTGTQGAGSSTVGTSRPNFTIGGNKVLTPSDYSWSDGSTAVGTTNPLSVSPTINTNYTATVTINNCPVVSNAVPVTVVALPTAPVGTNSAQCGTQVPSASVSDPNGYTTPTFTWYSASTGGTVLQASTATTYGTAISATTTFYVSVKNPASPFCESARTPVTVTVSAPDAVTAFAGGTGITGGSIAPAAVCVGAVNLYVIQSGTNQNYTYTWTASPVAGSGIPTSLVGQNVNPATTAAGNYTYTVTAVDGGCTTTAQVIQPVNAAANITGHPASPATAICNSGNATLSVTATGTAPLSYQWQSAAAVAGPYNNVAAGDANAGVTYAGAATATLNITGIATTYYYRVVVSNPGCSAVNSNPATITVNNPAVLSTTDGSRCGPGTVNLAATGTAGTTLNWYTGLTGGAAVATGPTFTTPSISATTPYYVSAQFGTSSNATIGAGASNTTGSGSSSGNNVSPFSHYYGGYKFQYLFRASELTAAGITAGNINSLSFFVNTAGATYNNFAINIGSTSATVLTTTFATPTFTNVYNGNVTPTTGTFTIPFSASFNWDGTSNVIVQLCWSNNNDGGTAAEVKYDNAGFNSLSYFRDDSKTSAVICGTTTAVGVSGNRPQVMFNYGNVCASSPRTLVTAIVALPAAITVSNAAAVSICNAVRTKYEVTSVLTDYDNYTWTVTGGTLYAAATGGTLYTPGSSATEVYFESTTAGAATITVNANNTVNGCVAVAVTKNITVLPASISAAAGATSFCLSGSTTLTINPSTAASYTNATIQWQSSPDGTGSWSDIASANGTTYTTPTLTANAYYRVIVKNSANADCLTSNVITITINNPSISATTPATRCGAGTVTLSATGSAGTTLNWYTASSGGSPVFTGSSYSPAVAATTTYYVAASSGGSGINGGRLAPTSTTTYNDGTTGLVFSVTTALTLNSVDVYNNGAAGNMVIRLVNSGGTTLQTSGTFTVPAGAGTTAYTANLGWSIPVGTGYRLIATSATTASLVRESSLGGFPYAIGSVASITGGWFGGASTSYYHFYNWSVSTVCESSRTAVTATVNIPPAISVSGTATICNGSSTNLGVSSTNDPAYTYTWTPGPLSGNAPSVSPATTTKYYVDALDNSGGANQGCTVRDSVTITVLPASVTAAAAAPICVSGSTTITLNPSTPASYTNGTIQWQSSPDGIGSWTDIGSANGVTYTTPTLTANGYYRALVKNSASANCLTSNVVTVVVNNPTIASFTPASRCGIGTVNLSATGSAGTSLNWYAASTGGAPLGTGNTFTTPSISATTTYYVDASIGSSNVTLGLAANSTSCGTPANATLSDWPLRFNTTTSSTLVSVDVIANSAGSYTFKLRASGSSTDILSTTQTLAAGIQTVTLNWPISSAGSYQITSTTGGLARVSTFTCTFPFTSPSGNVSIISSSNTSTGLNITSYYNCFYNLVFTEGCTSARTAVTATVTPPPALSLTNTAIDICSGTPSDTVRLTSPASSFNNYSWSPAAGVSGNATDGWVFNPSANTTYTLTGTQTSGSQCVNQLAVTVTVKPIPASPVVTPSTPVAICSGASQVLTATATGTTTDLINETFQTFSGTTLANGWSSTNTSVGGTVANATWRTRNSPYSYVDTYTGYTWLDFYSNDNSRFMLSNSDHQDGTTTSTTLQMPSFSTVGKVSADLILYHNYIHNEATDSATIEISTNGTAWNPLKIYKTDQGYVTYYGSDFDYDYYDVDMVKDSISLPAPYLNQATVYIRYRYQTGYAFWWAIDNVRVSAADPASIAWTANPTAGAGLPAGAGTPSVANTSIVINPTEPGTILYTASVTGSNGCKGTAVVTANVSANQWVGPNSGGDWNVAANWCGGVPTAASSVEIPATAVVDIKTANALAKNITIQGPGGGIQMLNSYSLIISNNGNLNNAGTLNATASTGAVVFVGNGTVTGTTLFKHVQVGNGGVDFGANSTIGAAGSLTLTSTSGYINNNAPFYDCTATLVYSSGGTFNRWIEWGTASSGKGFPGNVTVTNNTILNYPNGATDARAICGNLTVNAGSSFYMDYGSPDPTAALTIGGNVLLNGNMSLSEAAGGDLKVAGNWERGVAGVLTAHGRAIEFNGTALQTISRTGAGTENSFDYMIVNKASGNLQLRGTPAATSVVLNASAGNVLQLLNGNIDLNGQSLSMNNAGGNILVQGAARTLSGAAGSKFIINGYKTVTANAGGSLVTDVNVAVELNAAINFGPNLSTVNGILQLNAGSYVDINAPYYGNASLLRYNNNGVYERRVEWSGSTPSGTGYPNDVQVTNNTSLQPGGPGAPGSFISTTFNASRNVTIDAGSAIYMDATDKVMTVPLKVGGNLNIAGSLSASSAIGGDVYVSGNWLRTGTFTHNNRAVFFDGSSNATITATGGQEFAYAYLAKTGATLQLLDDVSITRELGPTSGTLDLAAKNITIRSTATATASVAPVSATLNYGTGRFIIERYISYPRKWQLLSVPAKSTQSIFDSWQDGGSSSSTPTGYGVQVTGPGPIAGTGLDAVSNTPSMKYQVGAATTYTGVTQTNTAGSLANPKGYYLYVYGNRSATANVNNPTPTTLRTTGRIFVGTTGNADQPAALTQVATALGDNISVGNPLPSAISFVALKAASGNIAFNYKVWDPSQFGTYGSGIYQTIDYATGGVATPGGGAIYNSAGTDYRTIQSGQAFFVQSEAAGTVTVPFEENMKVSGSRLASRGGSTPQENVDPSSVSMISAMMHGADGRLYDGNRVVLDNRYNIQVNDEDAIKVMNDGINFGNTRFGKALAVEARNRLSDNDTIHYHMTNALTGQYQLRFAVQNINEPLMQAILVDRFNNSRTPVSLTDSSFVNISITNDAASRAANRFFLVFKQTGIVPVTFVGISASRQADRSIAVKWQVQNEVNIVRYEVQRSANGVQFNGILQADAMNAGNYGRTDIAPLADDNFYRIKAIGPGGEITYSAIVKVSPDKQAASVAVTPNPVKDKQLAIRFDKQPAGAYAVQLTNALGQIVYKGVINVNVSAEVKTIPLHPKTAAGSYQLSIRNKAGEMIYSETILIE